MASGKYGAIITDMKGKIGGTIFKGTKSGPAIQNKQTSTAGTRASGKLSKADAGRVITPQRNMALLSSSWRSLSDIQRAAWNTAAPSFPFLNKFGEAYTGSGFQLYMQCNCNLLAISESAIDAPPLPLPLDNCPPFTIENISGDPSTLEIDGTIPAGYSMILSSTGNISAGRVPQPGMYKAIAVLPEGTVFPFALTDAFKNVFGPFPGTFNGWFSGKLSKADAGRTSVPYTLKYSQ